MVRITGAAEDAAGTSGVTLPGYGVAIVAVSLIAVAIHRADEGRAFALMKVIAIGPDAD
jgi:hypothetical protein